MSWDKLSMAEKADIMKLAVESGIYDLDTIRKEYNEFAKGGKKNQDTWTMEDEAKYREWRSSLPANLRNTDDNLYDMRGAYKAEMKPTLESDGKYHLGSRDPKTGRILKSPMHPTYLQAIATDAGMGYYPVVDNQGNTYTQTWEGNQYKEGGSIHIKPSHRGRLTELKKRTGKSEAELYNDGNPAHKKMVVFARNARKWHHAYGGVLDANDNMFLTGGPKRGRMPAHPRNREKDPEAYDAAKKWQEEQQLRRQQQEEQNRIYAEEKARSNEAAAKELNRRKDTVMSALSDIANSTPFTGSEVAEAAENQRQEKLDKWHDLKLGMDATMTAAELTAAGYGVVRGLTHANRWLARQATQSTGQAISREAMQNLLKWNNRVNKIDKAQVAMNTLGGIADGYQWATANNSFDAWENGLETGANAAGVVGGMNWFRDLPYLRRIGGDKIDAVLDGMGYSAAAWDVVKNLPPLSGALEGIREQSKSNEEEKACGGNLYPGGGFMGLMPAMPGIIAVKEGKDILSKAYHGIKQFIGLEDTEEELRQQRNADRYANSGYIGGEPRDTRQKYFDVDKEFTDSVNSISKRYGLNPSIVASRIAEEGPVDQAIIAYNDENNVGTQGQVLSDNGKGTWGPLWGLDDFYTRITNNDVRMTATAPYTYKKQNFINEQGRTTESITSPQWWFGIEATAAEMKARRDKLKKNNPWMTNQQLDAATAMSFNYGERGVQKHINSQKPIPKRFNPYIKTK